MSESTLPDVEGAVRAYLRATGSVSAVFGTRIFFGVDDPSAYPVAVIQRIGGGLDTTEGLHDVALLQVDVWGDVHDKATAFNGTSVVIAALSTCRNYETATTRLIGCNVQSWAFLPDESERSRYSLTVQCYAVPAVA